jgi:hypothetical protein
MCCRLQTIRGRGIGVDVSDRSHDGDGDDTGDGVGECGVAGGANPARAAWAFSNDKVVTMAAMNRTVPVGLLVLTLTAAVATSARAQEGPLDVARDLYASARYDEALAMLNGVRQQESGNPIKLRSIE